MNLFVELGVIFVVATLVSIGMKILRQPLVVGYIISGIIAGPYLLNIISSKDTLEALSKFGIVSLLFIVGISLNPKVIAEIGKPAVISGVGQVLFTSIGGYLIAIVLGFTSVHALYIAVALTFSSTIIILKLLNDKGDTNKLYGKISVGFLLVQDLIATIALVFVSTISTTDGPVYGSMLLLLFKFIICLIVLFIAAKYLLPPLSKFLASSQELLFLFSVTWGISLASIFSKLGFSAEIGALIGGVTLSVSPFSYEIASRMKPLREFFVVLFFILLGSQMVFSDFYQLLVPTIIFSAFVLIGNPIILLVIMNLLGYRKKVAFQTGLTVAQISEFSLILISLGFRVGHVDQLTLSLVTFVGLITISISTYLILNSDYLYNLLSPYISIFEFRKVKSKLTQEDNESVELLLFGYDRVGKHFVNAFGKLGRPFLVVDYNPKSIQKLRSINVRSRYGDAEDIEFLDELPIVNLKLFVSTIPEFETNALLVKHFKDKFPSTIAIVISHSYEEAKKLYALGASYVVMPHYLGAEYASKLINNHGLSKEGFKKEKEAHLKHFS